jgi:hypothetical protein
MDDLKLLQEQVAELMAWKQARTMQQLVHPVDDTSRLILRVVTGGGSGSTPTSTTTVISAVPTSITSNKLFTGTALFETPDGTFEVPYY